MNDLVAFIEGGCQQQDSPTPAKRPARMRQAPGT
jgi:2-haloacid dehalogenase